MVDAFKSSAAGRAELSDGAMFAHIYDIKTAGEATSQPHLRLPMMRADHTMRFFAASLRARLPATDEPVAIQDSDLILWFDGGRHGSAR
eukprot:3742837-Alexandrium_andersonii.AAC.1